MTRRILVVGGGIGGMAFAIRASGHGDRVEIVEVDPEWRVYGAGITITAPSYRAFRELGVFDEIKALGFFVTKGALVCRPDGTVVAELPSHMLEPDLPVTGGIMRPVLHDLLGRRTRAVGVDVRLGVTVSDWNDTDAGVDVTFTDGTTGRYDLVVGADGAFSPTRARLFPDAPRPEYTGQYCWRLTTDRLPEVDRSYFFFGPEFSAGLTPVSDTSMYMWLLDPRAKARVDDSALHGELRRVMASFGGIIGTLRDALTPQSNINVRPLEAVLLPAPWYRGRIILIGDAAHATTPHLASGAGMAVEDGLVLGDLLAGEADHEVAFARFMQRRYERCRIVVENSVAAGRLQQEHASPERIGALLDAAQGVLAGAI